MTVSLVIATFVFSVGVAVPLLFPRWPIQLRAVWRLSMLALLSALAQRIAGSPFHPVLLTDFPDLRLWQQAVVTGWWILAALCVAGMARLLLGLRHRSRETKILSDLVGAGIYAATALAIVDVVFAVPVGGLIATSGIIAVVIGLALQSTLADVFSGIAIDIERPYKAGDTLWIEGGVEGRVQEVNWRSTLVVTANGDIAIVPNSVMAKSRLVNHSLPALIRHVSVEVRLDPRVMPEACRKALEAAVRACLLPLHTPAPSVHLVNLQGDGASYEIGFSVPSGEDLSAARSEVFAQVQRHLAYAAIPMAVIGVPEMPVIALPGAADLLARSDLFGDLADAERGLLAEQMDELVFDEGAVLFAQDDAVDALYVISSGTVGLLRQQEDGSQIARRMSPGGCLGMIGLITGEPFAATASALTTVKTYRLTKAGIATAIAKRPELMAGLERLALRSQTAIRQDLAAEEKEHISERADLFLSRMRAFIRRLSSNNPRGGA